MKLTISLDDELVARADQYADENYMTRSGLIAFALNQTILSADVSKAVKDMSISLRRIADAGTVDEDALKQLEAFERLAQMLYDK